MLIHTEDTAYGRLRQPHSVGEIRYRAAMGEPNTKKQLCENVSRLMEHRYGGENLTRLANEAKFGPGSATRLKEQKTSVGVDLVDKLAKYFGLEPWQLLVPGLDPKAKPRLGNQPAEFSPEAAGVAEIVELLPSVEEKEALRVRIRTMVLDRMVSVRRAQAGSSSEKQSDPPNDRQAPDAS